jgi:excisionase family DNA binding protein
MEKLLTARELSEYVGVTVDTVWRWVRECRVPFVKFGSRTYRFRLSDFHSPASGTAIDENKTTV